MREYMQVENVKCIEKILCLSQVESISEEKSLNKASQPFLFKKSNNFPSFKMV
jgi:hypothetical protein